MANIKTELSENNKVKIIFAGRQARHLRKTGRWTDWMLSMDDFRDLIIPLGKEGVRNSRGNSRGIPRDTILNSN